MRQRLERQLRPPEVDLTARATALAARYDLPAPVVDPLGRQPAAALGVVHPAGRHDPHLVARSQSFPGWVVDAVVVHELAHLVEANHSPAFHALADRFPRQERATGFLIAKGLADPDLEEPD